MHQIDEFVDERQKSWCIHCGAWLHQLATNRDYVPSKSLLLGPYPQNLPVIEVCRACNEGFSLDEQYFIAFLSCVLSGSSNPEMQSNSKAKRLLGDNERLCERIEQSKTIIGTTSGGFRIIWQPEGERIKRVVVKNARGHAFFECGESPLGDPEQLWFAPLESLTPIQRNRFEKIEPPSVWPEVGSRMMTRLVTGHDLSGPWVTVQDSVYRYTVVLEGSVLVRTVLSEYLATEVCWS